MSDYDLIYIGRKATELGFIRDTLEKVYRLADVLEYCNTNSLLKENLALKGGTAINLTIFNLPRLSVDIDFDYIKTDSKEEMLTNREVINSVIDSYLISQGYTQSPKAKTTLSLDSWIYYYTNAAGNRDSIKLEINYSLRAHVLPSEERSIITEHLTSSSKIVTLSKIEIFGSKLNALLSRAAARDLYDVGNMVKLALFDKNEKNMLRKCVIFYAAVSAKTINKQFDTVAIDTLNNHKIKTELLPVIRTRDGFDLENTKKVVKEYLKELMILNKKETEFLERFENREYIPELLFDDNDILARIKNHPMVLWKMR